jgi:hypothetical protein
MFYFGLSIVKQEEDLRDKIGRNQTKDILPSD